MTVGCARCGHCCNPVKLDPETEYQLFDAPPGQEAGVVRADQDFARAHWKRGDRVLSVIEVQCDQFDQASGECQAHDSRPPICSGFPWYGRPPNGHKFGPEHSVDRHQGGRVGCSYLADLPAGWRPAGVRPLIPLEVLGVPLAR